MITERQMAMAYTAQEKISVALTEAGEVDLAGRLDRCMTAGRERHYGDGWPFSYPGCAWCRPPLIQ